MQRDLRIRGPVAVFLVALVAAAVAPPTEAKADQVELQLEPSPQVGLDELAILRIKIEGNRQGVQPIPEFELENFEVVAGPSQSTSLTIFNGVPSSSLTLSWRLRPLAIGTASVHSASLRLDNEVVPLTDRQVEVIEHAPARARSGRLDPFSDPFDRGRPGARSPLEGLLEPRRRRNAPRRQPKAPEVFLQAVASPDNPYVGQQVLYTLYLFTQVDVRSVNPSSLPGFKGFWSREVPQPDQSMPEMVTRDGERFGKVVLLERALFPRRAGTLEIEPVVARLAAMVPDSSLFGSLMPRAREISRSSNAISLDVRELPGAPANFKGAVGRLSLATDLTPNNLEVGDAATLTVTLQGKGHLQGIPVPDLPELGGIKVFPPQQDSTEGLDGKWVTGRRSWSFVLVPERPGEWQIPAIEVPYFDPDRNEFRIASGQSLQLSVRGSTSLVREGQTVDLHPIRTAALPNGGNGGWKFSSLLPWLLGLPWLLIAFLSWSRRARSGPSSASSRKKLLAGLGKATADESPRHAAGTIETLWRDFLAERWQIPPGAPSPQWGQLLQQQGVTEATTKQLMELADDIHYLRYAPKLSSTTELRQELVARSRKLVRAL